VAGVAEDESSDNLLSGGRVDINASVGSLLAVLEESSTTSSQNVSSDLGTLRVTTDNKLNIGAANVV
jgi:hypothetical protein